MSPNLSLYLALALYACGTLVALATLFARELRMQQAGLILMISGWVLHTFWIGSICVRTHHPPLTNLPEAAAFISWMVFAAELALFIRDRVHAAAFFVYPLVLILLTVSAVVSEPFVAGDPALRSRILTAHILLTTVGVAALVISLSFHLIAYLQDRALRAET